MTLTIASFALLVDDYDRGIAYFRDVIGFDGCRGHAVAGRQTVGGDGGRGRRSDASCACGSEQRAAVGNQTGGRVGCFLETSDFAADYGRLTAAGVQFLEAPRHEDYGSVVVFADAFGNKWDLVRSRAGRPPEAAKNTFSSSPARRSPMPEITSGR